MYREKSKQTNFTHRYHNTQCVMHAIHHQINYRPAYKAELFKSQHTQICDNIVIYL